MKLSCCLHPFYLLIYRKYTFLWITISSPLLWLLLTLVTHQLCIPCITTNFKIITQNILSFLTHSTKYRLKIPKHFTKILLTIQQSFHTYPLKTHIQNFTFWLIQMNNWNVQSHKTFKTWNNHHDKILFATL
jgi:hypothetical protein